ncbi:hypothetical protein [Nonomuraea soli]|uniref:Uncharacterized protein n=1 Tax=Nonomuraea soli TaxID=1032476 RepID=A0A7W0CU76_9ACTN|nr:hypothetical protein [Nonomuraea soli]MBA2897436.1 hypothetical protein [Nonomuraea soli]
MDIEGQGAAALLVSLGRASEVFFHLDHPHVRHQAFSYLIPDGGAATGTVFTLPDGREVHFSVSFALRDGAFRIEGTAAVEDEALLSMPVRLLPDLHEAIAVLERYVDEVTEPVRRLVDELLEELA